MESVKVQTKLFTQSNVNLHIVNGLLSWQDLGKTIVLKEFVGVSIQYGKTYGIITKNGFRMIKKILKSSNKNNYLLAFDKNNTDKVKFPLQEIPKNLVSKLFEVV
ncbi:hypothetical protein [Tenacibaculum finnmarkense]|uniref:hypothetical protein n=1 Tax=Tenacibaculum finnmarkense TaxID=2781243 RepID=UPI00187B4AC3|nr:hypothetical protein [Tenacibaculum finnmarkense]MBE7691524.1 hypothetical protein [Tenacibaculum finnmarkense genomovar finnmarkense]